MSTLTLAEAFDRKMRKHLRLFVKPDARCDNPNHFQLDKGPMGCVDCLGTNRVPIPTREVMKRADY